MFGLGKKSTVATRAETRPKANLFRAGGLWLLKKLHRQGVQMAATAGVATGAFLVGKGWDSGGAQVIGGAIGAALAAGVNQLVIWILRRFVVDLQDQYDWIESDAFPGPKTRAAAGVPKHSELAKPLDDDNIPRAIPVPPLTPAPTDENENRR